tara:strand:- start:164 stop:304 length:141 start_codon:yes stop_codon:yes gene_type:complete
VQGFLGRLELFFLLLFYGFLGFFFVGRAFTFIILAAARAFAGACLA